MRNLIKFAVLAVVLSCGVSAKAAMVCEGLTELGTTLKLSVDLQAKRARVEVAAPDGTKDVNQVFQRVDHVWDGHMTGLITALGLSVKYENHYGCYRNIVITTNISGGGTNSIQVVQVANCRGGSTRDEICLR